MAFTPARRCAATASAATRHEIVFIDTSTQNYEQLVADVRGRNAPGTQTEVVLLDPGRDGIAQISETLAGRSDIDAVHILSHGSAGEIKLGNVSLTQDQLTNYQPALQSWRGALSADADLLIYGCEVAGGRCGAGTRIHGRGVDLELHADFVVTASEGRLAVRPADSVPAPGKVAD
jgi:hypothetical protein